MSITNPFWISRKEIASITGFSYEVIRRNEDGFGLSLLRVTVNARTVLYPRKETLDHLQRKFPWLRITSATSASCSGITNQ